MCENETILKVSKMLLFSFVRFIGKSYSFSLIGPIVYGAYYSQMSTKDCSLRMPVSLSSMVYVNI